jgi:hypothetical protein
MLHAKVTKPAGEHLRWKVVDDNLGRLGSDMNVVIYKI